MMIESFYIISNLLRFFGGYNVLRTFFFDGHFDHEWCTDLEVTPVFLEVSSVALDQVVVLVTEILSSVRRPLVPLLVIHMDFLICLG